MKYQTRNLFYLLIAVTFPNLSNAQNSTAPRIESISYAGNEIIIIGKDFKVGPNVVAFENFTDEEKLKNLKESPNSWLNNYKFHKEELKRTNISHRANNNPAGSTAPKSMAQLFIDFGAVYHQAFIAFSVKVPEGSTFSGASNPKEFPSMSSWKFTWLMLGKNGFQNEDFDICIPSHVGNGSFLIGGNDGNLTWLKNGKEWWDWENYNYFSTHIAFDNKENPSEIKYQFDVNNSKTHYGITGATPTSKLSSKRFGFDRIQIPGWWGNGDSRNFEALYDNIYVAVGENSMARIVLSDEKNIVQSKEVITIPAKKWNNDEIIIDSTSIYVDKPYYLHIYDMNGKKSSEDTRICPHCPGKPRN